ncbi:MAG: aminotransferase class III-fold pyridoxal phosphate-dependent enzyme [Gemmatimonadetes bacterium]|nr:aminotransferase class III-fold pyridoxal phosphate-dependent enzyme [Gemmatimonadota bacterium]
MRIPGFTSTGSKRPEALFGPGAPRGLPVRFTRSAGARLWDAEGREYLDLVMALGAVGLGYGHPAVARAAHAAIDAGVVGSLPPELEERVAERLAALVPGMERTRFLKTGAEAVAAAVRLARAHTGREAILRCGYHGWLDWCQPAGTPGVPGAVAGLLGELPFNDSERARFLVRRAGERLAAVVIEPVVEAAPDPEWLEVLREETRRAGALLIFDEIKTGFRVGIGGAAARYGGAPDLLVFGKALANGFPLAAVGGRRPVMEDARRTWISSTLATEMVALAAADATLEVVAREQVPAHLERVGTLLLDGLSRLAARYPGLLGPPIGVPEMCALTYPSEEAGIRLARFAAEQGLLFKRNAYNFVSLAHGPAEVAQALAVLEEGCRILEGDGT